MKFQELKSVADIKDRFEVIREKNRVSMEEASRFIEKKKRDITAQITGDFHRFFQKLNFDIESGDHETVAVYKSIRITLKSLNPGRREDDIACILRFLLTVGGIREELYRIFVRSRELEGKQDSIPAGTVEKTGEKPVYKDLKLQAAQLERLASRLHEALPHFTDDAHRSVLQQMDREILKLRTDVRNTMSDMSVAGIDLWIGNTVEEWQGADLKRYDNVYSFLVSLDYTG